MFILENFWDRVLVVIFLFLLWGFGFFVGMSTNTTHETPRQVTPDITITNKGGVVDTTYTYTFRMFDTLNQ